MAQASQQLPSWLTLSSTLVTEPDGSVSTSFATLRLPLTYFGPSIPLGTDGVWTFGGSTSPGPSTAETTATSITSASFTSASSIASPSITSAPSAATSGSAASSLPPTVVSPSPSTSTSSTSSSTTSSAVPIAQSTSHGISTAVLGAILGSILGFLLLLVIILTLCLIRRNSRRHSDPNEQSSSSFWNRQTSLWSRRTSARQTPIWTGWQLVDPVDADEFAQARDSNTGNAGGHSGSVGSEGFRTPGEGSPRGSGEEDDPFLTRRSLHSATDADDMTQTKSGSATLVSVPAAAAMSGSVRTSPPRLGHILPRDVLIRMTEEDDQSPEFGDIRIVQPSPPQEYSPLMPPPPLDPDHMMGLGIRTSRNTSNRSLASQTQKRSIHSEKSLGSLETDSHERAEFLVAKRVRLADQPRSHTTVPESGPSGVRSALGLSGLSGRLGRLSWFKRMSYTGASQSDTHLEGAIAAASDSYTRTPPRSRASHSRPGSRSHLLDDPELGVSTQRRDIRRDSGVGFGLLAAPATRPISSLSTKSTGAASGRTVYHDASSRPASSLVMFPEPVISSERQEQLSRVAVDNRVTLSAADIGVPFNAPPAYNENPLSWLPPGALPPNVDVLDTPAPGPSVPFSSGRSTFPPGLTALPDPRTWRDSYLTDSTPYDNRSSAGIAVDILEEEPPEAQEDWRDLAAERDGRRRTFGIPTVIHPEGALTSQHPSLHTLHSRLRPQTSQSPVRSAAPSSNHTLTASGSSRPSTTHLRSMSSAQSLAVSGSSDERRERSDELISPPLSAVHGNFGSTGSTRPPSYQIPPLMPPLPEVVPSSSRTPLLGGTVTSSNTSRTTGTATDSSVTTAATDPVTGAVLHFPALPWRREHRDSWTGRRRDDSW